jgi:hypothetical protein
MYSAATLPGEQLQDAGTGDHVERGGRLIEDDQFWPGSEGGGDNDALFLPARDLVRIARQQCLRRVQADMVQRLDRDDACSARGKAAMQLEHLGDLPPKGEGRVQRGGGILEHHADAPAADGADLARGHCPQIRPIEAQAAGDLARVGRQMPRDRPGQRGFAGARFADQTQHLTRADRQRHVVQHAQRAGAGAVLQRIGRDVQDRAHRSSRGFIASRSPSPSRLKPIADSAMAAAGAMVIQGA